MHISEDFITTPSLCRQGRMEFWGAEESSCIPHLGYYTNA